MAAALITLQPLRKQLHEMRLQTQFMTGGDEPTVDAYQAWSDGSEGLASGSAEVFVRIVNWNRKSLFIERLEADLSADEHQLQPNYFSVRNSGAKQKYEGEELDKRLLSRTPIVFRKPLYLYGWEDRSAGPNAIHLNFWLHTDIATVTEREVKIRVIGFHINEEPGTFQREPIIRLRSKN
ncbi:hypothetical protein [Aurantimonas sp. 22II-16-19i]|uniref:hypothetical protein n=1 Tax=Aurantimonas sp. 22II-16-19i TaxID=1317114 RepID=UPI00111BD039|nr:hypothetical protein [Aurantimonas sp. 22II-16-19i]